MRRSVPRPTDEAAALSLIASSDYLQLDLTMSWNIGYPLDWLPGVARVSPNLAYPPERGLKLA